MNKTSLDIEVNPFMIAVVRSVHTLVALLMFASMAVVYYSAISETYGTSLYLASVALLIEGIAITLNKGDCPLSYLQRKYGDDKTFFELFMPKRIAKQMFRVNFVVITIGYMLLLLSLTL